LILSALTSVKLSKSGPDCILALTLWTVLGTSPCLAQPSDPAANERPAVTLKSVRKVVDKKSTAIEIQCTAPVTPAIREIDNPPRLLIDVACSRGEVEKTQYGETSEIKSISVGQAPNQPASSRIEVELSKQTGYSLENSGKKLLVRLTPSQSTPAPTNSHVPTGSQPVASASSGGLLSASGNLDKGGAITAGATTRVLRLARGGEVHICPGTSVSFTPSRSGREMMLALNTGALETHYNLATSADSILTPDFRILLPGPGEFDFAVSSDARGNTCIRALPGNTASAVVSELMGDRTYQVKPNDQLVFRAGSLDKVDQQIPSNCGCPAPAMSTMTASAEPPPVSSSVPVATPNAGVTNPSAPNTNTSNANTSRATLSGAQPENAPLPPSNPNDVHVTVDSSFVFQASDMPNAVVQQAAALPPTSSSRRADLAPEVLPPVSEASSPSLTPAAAAPQHRGFFGKVKGFFAKLFL
jgi:hypothetical protein